MSAGAETTKATTHAFQADVGQVLSLVINSLYSHREIFLRELISNASDALDKLRYRSLTDHSLASDDVPGGIRVSGDAKAKTVTIEDFGVGMTREELVENLGTVARSGTRAFFDAVQAGAEPTDMGLIGQFGVGFYSAWLVAETVEVISRATGEDAQAWRWTSDAKESFTIEPAERAHHGSTVILHLREDAGVYAESWQLKQLIERYSDYIDHPIKLVSPAIAAEGEEAGEPTEEQVNRGGALWKRAKDTISDEDYESFYKHVTHDFEGPAARTHFTVEGTRLFTGLLFVPKRPPMDLFSQEPRHGVRLYVKRVFIMDDCDELLPRWLRFVRGVVDSDDLPLNVSREILQDSAVVRTIQKQVTRRSLDMIGELAEDKEAYADFWENFGLVLKEGVHMAPEHKQKLGKLLRFRSSAGDGWTSLDEAKERMVEGQKALYYVMAQSLEAAKASPHLEALRQRGYEVLYLTDPIDEWVVMSLDSWDETPLSSAMKSDLELSAGSEEEEQAREVAKEAVSDLLERFQAVLGDAVGEVRASTRLTDSPACLVVPQGGMHAHIERLLRATDRSGMMPETRRIMEINPSHPVIERLSAMHEAAPESEDVAGWVRLVHEQALLAEGSPLPDPAGFARRMTALMGQAIGAGGAPASAKAKTKKAPAKAKAAEKKAPAKPKAAEKKAPAKAKAAKKSKDAEATPASDEAGS